MTENNYSGIIEVNNSDINGIDPRSWHSRVAFVTQDVFLFNGTLRYNICLNSPMTDKQLWEVIQKVGLVDFVNTLPNGLDSSIGENGDNLSGGEKQRIAFARALVKKSDVLFVDEATSALDVKNADNIENIIFELDKMVIVISHKYDNDLLQRFDKVILMDKGRITEQRQWTEGIHTLLLDKEITEASV